MKLDKTIIFCFWKETNMEKLYDIFGLACFLIEENTQMFSDI